MTVETLETVEAIHNVGENAAVGVRPLGELVQLVDLVLLLLVLEHLLLLGEGVHLLLEGGQPAFDVVKVAGVEEGCPAAENLDGSQDVFLVGLHRQGTLKEKRRKSFIN